MYYTLTHPFIPHPYNPDLATGEGVATVASAADEAGLRGFRCTDRPAPTQQWLDNEGHNALDPFVALGSAAARISKIRLIPNALVLPTAMAVGAGYLKGEFAALGVGYEERVRLLDEGIDAIRSIWTNDDVSHEVGHFTARGINVHPRPVSQPHPPYRS